jgi:hypothetical protein
MNTQLVESLAQIINTLTKEEKTLLNTRITNHEQTSFDRRRLISLTLDQRRDLLGRQAQEMISFYESDPEWKEFQGGDFIEY